MLRAGLIAILIAAQGVPALAGGMVLCLHADGGYCLEMERDCCGHSHRELDPACFPTHAEHSVGIEHRCEHTCACTHLALPSVTPATRKVNQAQSREQDLNLSCGVVSPTALAPAAIADQAASATPVLAFGGRCAALLLLAPVMLRC